MIEILKIINFELQKIGINYEFMEWTSDVVYPYFVGEYEDEGGSLESGMGESIFMLTGTTRGSWKDLQDTTELIKSHFNDFRTIIDNSSGIWILYDRGFPIPTGEQDLKRIQINLKIREWKVNN